MITTSIIESNQEKRKWSRISRLIMKWEKNLDSKKKSEMRNIKHGDGIPYWEKSRNDKKIWIVREISYIERHQALRDESRIKRGIKNWAINQERWNSREKMNLKNNHKIRSSQELWKSSRIERATNKWESNHELRIKSKSGK